MRDIYHREWNDMCFALKSAQVWWAVILSTVAFNLPYGPWEGSAWFGQLVEGSRGLLAQTPSAGHSLVDAFYPKLCADVNARPSGSAARRYRIIDSMCASEG